MASSTDESQGSFLHRRQRRPDRRHRCRSPRQPSADPRVEPPPDRPGDRPGTRLRHPGPDRPLPREDGVRRFRAGYLHRRDRHDDLPARPRTHRGPICPDLPGEGRPRPDVGHDRGRRRRGRHHGAGAHHRCLCVPGRDRRLRRQRAGAGDPAAVDRAGATPGARQPAHRACSRPSVRHARSSSDVTWSLRCCN